MKDICTHQRIVCSPKSCHCVYCQKIMSEKEVDLILFESQSHKFIQERREYYDMKSGKLQLISDLQALQSDKDYERAHGLADELLLAYINDKEVTEAFNKITKHYA